MKDTLFHLAFPTHDVGAAKRFYVDGLGCTLGRESSHAVTFGLARPGQIIDQLRPRLSQS
jgi:extradiol dioxygenase family protein